ncbi:MAG: hypothetical protein JWL61_2454 [Gemmatimonadetes bacterium]|nr:hypothetical protein [Gemmatimonadota bacterium]
MPLESHIGRRATSIDFSPTPARAISLVGDRSPATERSHERGTGPAREAESRLSGASAAVWTANWCRPLDTVVALVVLLAIVFVATADVRPGGLSAFLAFRVTVKNALLLGVFVVIWPVALTFTGAYDESRTWSLRATVVRVLVGCSLGTAASMIVPLTSRSGRLGVVTLVALWAGTVAGTLVVHLGARMSAFVRRQRSTPRRIVIAGIGPRAATLWKDLNRHPLVRYELVAVTDVPGAESAPVFVDHDFVANTEIEAFFMHSVVDEVFIALPVKSRYEEIEQIIGVCERGGVHSLYLADTFSSTIARPRINTAGNLSVVSMNVVHDDWRLLVKRAIDFGSALFGVVLLSPLLLMIALTVKLTSPGPVVFSQVRVGLNKRRFKMYKFRTMVLDAESLQASLESRNEVDGPAFKIKNDPRVTRVGAFLRHTSLDELPQLWNVIRGDMALVGPRPLPLRDVSRFEEAWLMRRFSVRPGLTCLWQIGGRNELGFGKWVELDLKYIDRWSLALDLAVLLKTVPAVLRRTGAS